MNTPTSGSSASLNKRLSNASLYTHTIMKTSSEDLAARGPAKDPIPKILSKLDELEREKEEALRPLTSGIMETGMDESGDYKRQVSNESLKDPQVQALSQQLKEWINDVLTDDHIVVKNLCEDLSDGQVLSALIEKLAGAKIEHKEVAQSIASQKAKLTEVLNQINYHLQVVDDGIKWNVDNIHNKYLISVLHLLVALARHYGIPRRLPSFVKIQVLQITKATQQTETISEQITGDEEREHYNFAARQQERDVFDTLFDSAPDKLNAVKGSLMAFANKQLSQINRGCSNIEEDFANGVNLVVMMSLAEGYYVPMYSFSMEPEAYDHKLHNVTLALNLMQEAGIPRPKCTAESIVSKDLKSTLRVLYAIYSKYKHLVK
ncbi:alpha-parvin-like isoform X2 [Bolinopsis microptera]|uniref:alpha-parvin-like isoform X2 n=1 Tax=Bolinopsis microptera TaxID=2820187 RepID=UPI0030793138